MAIREHPVVPVGDALARLPEEYVRLAHGEFDHDDEEYAETVRRIVTDGIGTGAWASFVFKRSFAGAIADYTVGRALTVFRRLLARESSAHWTFVVHTRDRTLVGATPERHLTLHGGTAVMNPVSGTYRYPPSGPTLPSVVAFLADRKEADELCMVVDKELKMMARICERGVRLSSVPLCRVKLLDSAGVWTCVRRRS
ncbi:chorismate-binding protein [Streptomyces noursei]|uniref:chorismate-binding protein n=1 Tax=Streptomyces noursei TaxID=1971 RepID=UPI0026C5615A